MYVLLNTINTNLTVVKVTFKYGIFDLYQEEEEEQEEVEEEEEEEEKEEEQE